MSLAQLSPSLFVSFNIVEVLGGVTLAGVVLGVIKYVLQGVAITFAIAF
jgi:hypothetical protein